MNEKNTGNKLGIMALRIFAYRVFWHWVFRYSTRRTEIRLHLALVFTDNLHRAINAGIGV